MARALSGIMLLTPPDLMDRSLGDATTWGRFGLNLRRLGGQEMMELLRVLLDLLGFAKGFSELTEVWETEARHERVVKNAAAE